MLWNLSSWTFLFRQNSFIDMKQTFKQQQQQQRQQQQKKFEYIFTMWSNQSKAGNYSAISVRMPINIDDFSK